MKQYSTSTSVTSAPKPSLYGQTVTLTATVSSTAPGGATGTVTFKNGTTTMGTLMLSAGKAILQTAKLPAGTLTITASYNGDVKNAKSLGATTQTVSKATTKTTLSSSLNPSKAGQLVRFTGTVSSPTSVPTGSVTFMDGGSTLGTVSLSAGKASYSTSTLTTGSHSIGPVYNGTVNVSGSTSAPLVEIVH